jgi:hypothetical protein
MASETVAVRLPEKVLEELQRKATAQNKKVSELVRELIIKNLANEGNDNAASISSLTEQIKKLEERITAVLQSAQVAPPAEVEKEAEPATAAIQRQLELMHSGLGDLILKSAKASAEASFYARLSALYSNYIGDPEENGAKIAEMDQMCAELAKKYLTKPLQF